MLSTPGETFLYEPSRIVLFPFDSADSSLRILDTICNTIPIASNTYANNATLSDNVVCSAIEKAEHTASRTMNEITNGAPRFLMKKLLCSLLNDNKIGQSSFRI